MTNSQSTLGSSHVVVPTLGELDEAINLALVWKAVRHAGGMAVLCLLAAVSWRLIVVTQQASRAANASYEMVAQLDKMNSIVEYDQQLATVLDQAENYSEALESVSRDDVEREWEITKRLIGAKSPEDLLTTLKRASESTMLSQRLAKALTETTAAETRVKDIEVALMQKKQELENSKTYVMDMSIQLDSKQKEIDSIKALLNPNSDVVHRMVAEAQLVNRRLHTGVLAFHSDVLDLTSLQPTLVEFYLSHNGPQRETVSIYTSAELAKHSDARLEAVSSIEKLDYDHLQNWPGAKGGSLEKPDALIEELKTRMNDRLKGNLTGQLILIASTSCAVPSSPLWDGQTVHACLIGTQDGDTSRRIDSWDNFCKSHQGNLEIIPTVNDVTYTKSTIMAGKVRMFLERCLLTRPNVGAAQ